MSRSITVLLAALCLGSAAHAADTVEPPSAIDTLKQKTGKLLMNVKPFMVEGAYSQFHPLLQSVREEQHLEPVIPRAQQQAQARGKLAEWMKQHDGKRPNILILLVDDMGWGDPGAYGDPQDEEADPAARPPFDHDGGFAAALLRHCSLSVRAPSGRGTSTSARRPRERRSGCSP